MGLDASPVGAGTQSLPKCQSGPNAVDDLLSHLLHEGANFLGIVGVDHRVQHTALPILMNHPLRSRIFPGVEVDNVGDLVKEGGVDLLLQRAGLQIGGVKMVVKPDLHPMRVLVILDPRGT